ncbi:MAG: phosphodiester glycosidase family protein [Bacteroidales bacterium]
MQVQHSPWIHIDDGLYIGRFIAQQKSQYGNSEIIVIKIDPEIYTFRLLSAAEMNHQNLNTRQWCEKYNLIGAVNAGMFQADYKSNVGYMKNFDYTNNRRISPSYHSVAAFNPKDSLNPSFRIIDTDEMEIQQFIDHYHTVIQNLRLIKSPAQNRWSQQEKMWSEAALGQDREGNVLFIFSRSPYSMHDFNKILIQLPIDIVNAMHLEGGPEASLYFNFNGIEIEGAGSYETNFNENDNNDYPSTLPNVIGFEKRKQ